MPTAIDRIRSKNKPVAKIELSPIAISAPKPATAVQPERSTTLAVQPAATSNASTLPPPIPCPICDCPAIWSSIYEPQAFRCCVCDPPPGGNLAWHHQRGGWSFVGRRLMLVDGETGSLEWKAFQRHGAETQPNSQGKQSAALTTKLPTPGGIIYLPPITIRGLLGGLTGHGFPGKPTPTITPEIIDTRRKCSRCEKRYVLAELNPITGGELCWTCWSRRQRSAA